MIRWGARMPFRDAAHAVVGGWHSGCCWRWPMPRSTPPSTSTCGATWTERSAPSPPRSWHRPPTAPASICIRFPRRRSPRANSPTPSCRSCLPMAPFGWRRRPSGDLPPLVGHDQVKAALDGRAPLVSLVVDGRPGRAAVLRTEIGGQRYAVMVGLFRDGIDGPSLPAGVGARARVGGGTRDDRRARLLAGVEGAGAGRRDFAARRTDRARRFRREAGSAGPAGRGRRDDADRSTRSSIACTARSRDIAASRPTPRTSCARRSPRWRERSTSR